MFCVFLFTALVAEVVFAIGTGVSWESFEDYAGMPPGLVLIHSIVWAKFYNDLYVKGLIERGFKAFEVEKLKYESSIVEHPLHDPENKLLKG